MKTNKVLIAAVLIIRCGIGWFFLLRPEQISQETLTDSFQTKQQAYQDIASYLTEKNISTEIDNFPIAGKNYENVKYEDTDAYKAFINAIYVIMETDHDLIVSDGRNVEFVYHSTGGLLNAKKGSLIFTVEDSPARTEITPLPQKGWYLWLPD